MFRPDIEQQKKTDRRLDLGNYNRMVRRVGALSNILGIGGTNGVVDESGVYVETGGGASSSLDLSVFAFGVNSVSGNQVTFNAGYVIYGATTISVGGTTVSGLQAGTLASPSFAYVDITVGATPTAQIVAAAISSYPQTDESNIRVALASYYLRNGVLTLRYVHHVGDIHVLGALV